MVVYVTAYDGGVYALERANGRSFRRRACGERRQHEREDGHAQHVESLGSRIKPSILPELAPWYAVATLGASF